MGTMQRNKSFQYPATISNTKEEKTKKLGTYQNLKTTSKSGITVTCGKRKQSKHLPKHVQLQNLERKIPDCELSTSQSGSTEWQRPRLMVQLQNNTVQGS
jgi:hypothetical protein